MVPLNNQLVLSSFDLCGCIERQKHFDSTIFNPKKWKSRAENIEAATCPENWVHFLHDQLVHNLHQFAQPCHPVQFSDFFLKIFIFFPFFLYFFLKLQSGPQYASSCSNLSPSASQTLETSNCLMTAQLTLYLWFVDELKQGNLRCVNKKLASLKATLVETTTHPLTDGGEV